MNQVYQIKHPETFKSAILDWYELSQQLGDDDSESLLREMHSLFVENKPLAPIWGPGVHHSFESISPVSEAIPDISSWGGPMLLLNARAHDLLRDRLALEGEFLPIMVDGEPMQIFRCLSFAQEQEELCVRRYFQGMPLEGLETLTFREDDVADRFLFLSKLEGGSKLYCSTQFKALVTELRLEGLRFDADLLDPF